MSKSKKESKELGSKDKELFAKWSEMHKDIDIPTKDKEREFKLVREVLKKFYAAKTSRQNSCYWKNHNSDTSGSGAGGGDWGSLWDSQEKSYTMWHQQGSSDDFQSNIKSPMVTGRVNAFVNQWKKLNLGWDAFPNNEEDYNSAQVASKLMNYWYNKTNAKDELNSFAWEIAVHGTGFIRATYRKEVKRIRPAITDPKKMDEKQKKMFEDGYRGLIFGEPEDIVTNADIKLEHVPIREMFVDPDAVTIHGTGSRARYVIRRRLINIEEFRQKYASNPAAVNVDKVKSLGKYRDTDYSFFEKPSDMMGNDTVELLEFEGQLTNTHDANIVIANDLLILDSVLPSHKEITYHKADFITFPGQLYGIGIPDLLMNLQGGQEILINMANDYIYRSYNYRFLVDSTTYGELDEEAIRPDNAFIPIDLSDNRPIGAKIQQLVSQPIGFDLFRIQDIIEQNATMATSIDPQQLALSTRGKTATETVMNKENLEVMIAGVVDNIVNQALFPLGRQVWKLMQQYYTQPEVKKIVGDDGEITMEPKYKKIRLEGLELQVEADDRVKFKEIEGFSYFDLNEKYLSTEDEIDIVIRPETMEIQSKALRMQKVQELFAQIIQFAADPSNPVSMQNPNAYVNGVKLFQYLFQVIDAPDDLLIQPEENEELDEKKAEEHIMKILGGENVPAEPGQGKSHIRYQARVIFALNEQIKGMQQNIDDVMKAQEDNIMKLVDSGQIIDLMSVTGNPTSEGKFIDASGAPVELPQPEAPQDLVAKIGELVDVTKKLQEHTMVESLPEDALGEVAVDPSAPNMAEALKPPAPEGPMPPAAPMPGGPQEGPVPMPEGAGMQEMNPNFGGNGNTL